MIHNPYGSIREQRTEVSEERIVAPCSGCRGAGVILDEVEEVLGYPEDVEKVCPGCRGEGRIVRKAKE